MSKINRFYTSAYTLARDARKCNRGIPILVEALDRARAYIANGRLSSTGTEVRIPKKRSRKMRKIYVQPTWMSTIHRILLSIIEARWKHSESTVGMQKGTSVKKAVEKLLDISKKVCKDDPMNTRVISLDLTDYFDSISQTLIAGVLQTEDILQLTDKFSYECRRNTYNSISLIATDGAQYMRQGMTLSPIIANIIGEFVVDKAVYKSVNNITNNQFGYIRYADNIYIVIDDSVQVDIEKLVQDIDTNIQTIAKHYIPANEKCMIKINNAKTKSRTIAEIRRLCAKILGCSIYNLEPAVGRAYWIRTKMAIHKDLLHYGKICSSRTHGLISRLKDVEPEKYNKLATYISKQEVICAMMRYNRFCETHSSNKEVY